MVITSWVQLGEQVFKLVNQIFAHFSNAWRKLYVTYYSKYKLAKKIRSLDYRIKELRNSSTTSRIIISKIKILEKKKFRLWERI